MSSSWQRQVNFPRCSIHLRPDVGLSREIVRADKIFDDLENLVEINSIQVIRTYFIFEDSDSTLTLANWFNDQGRKYTEGDLTNGRYRETTVTLDTKGEGN